MWGTYTMSRLLAHTLLLVLLTIATLAAAQEPSTVGGRLDQGGVQLSKAELLQTHSKATMIGVQRGTGAKFRNLVTPDGKIKGSAILANGRNVDVFANWTVADNGEFQGEYQNSPGNRWESNAYYFRLGQRYFTALTIDRNADVREMMIERH